jgi:hypothetical protein
MAGGGGKKNPPPPHKPPPLDFWVALKVGVSVVWGA